MPASAYLTLIGGSTDWADVSLCTLTFHVKRQLPPEPGGECILRRAPTGSHPRRFT